MSLPDIKPNRPRVVTHLLTGDGEIPNNERLPLLAYAGAVDLRSGDPGAVFEALFRRNEWTGSWRNGIFSFNHYHSTAHEVLGVYDGSARVQLGGEHGITLDIEAGDMIIIPAGVGHKKLHSNHLAVVGAYAGGRHPDTCKPGEYARERENIRAVPLPAFDPIYGQDGPLFDHWIAQA